jgi:hypothetical protein
MEKISTSLELKNAIIKLEADQDANLQMLKFEVFVVYDSLKPVNLLKKSIRDFTSSPYLLDDVIGAVTSFASGFLSRKIIEGKSNNPLRKLIGIIVQFGVTNVVAQNADSIKDFVRYIFSQIFPDKNIKD